MRLFTDEQERQLKSNGWKNVECIVKDADIIDFKPVVKLFCPWGGATWLLTELDPENNEIAFGLCDLGMGEPEIGNVSLAEIASVRGPGGLTIERDIHFRADKTLQGYAEEARQAGRIMA